MRFCKSLLLYPRQIRLPSCSSATSSTTDCSALPGKEPAVSARSTCRHGLHAALPVKGARKRSKSISKLTCHFVRRTASCRCSSGAVARPAVPQPTMLVALSRRTQAGASCRLLVQPLPQVRHLRDDIPTHHAWAKHQIDWTDSTSTMRRAL